MSQSAAHSFTEFIKDMEKDLPALQSDDESEESYYSTIGDHSNISGNMYFLMFLLLMMLLLMMFLLLSFVSLISEQYLTRPCVSNSGKILGFVVKLEVSYHISA